MSWLDVYRPESGRYVVFRTGRGKGGLGDRVVGLVSACVAAMLTQRHFRVVWNDPFPLTDAWRSHDPRLPWDRADFDLAEMIHDTCSVVDRWFNERSFRDTNLLACREPCQVIEANQPFFVDLLVNPYFREAAARYRFPPPAQLYRELIRALFVPSPKMAQALSPWESRLRAQPFVGLQVRTLWNWQDGGGAVQEADLKRFGMAVEHLSHAGTRSVFVSADDERIAGIVRDWFPEMDVQTLPNRILHVDRSDWDSPDDYVATFMNVHLLAMCESLVISHWSNLGRLAAFWGGKRPWITRKEVCQPPGPHIEGAFRQADLAELIAKEDPLLAEAHASPQQL